jgi:hypothetical protein
LRLTLSLQWQGLLAHAPLLCCDVGCRRHSIASSSLLPQSLGSRSRHVGSVEAEGRHLLLLLLQALAGTGGTLRRRQAAGRRNALLLQALC